MSTASGSITPTPTTLAWLPIGMFGAVMGLSGLALAWKLAHRHFGLTPLVGQALGIAAVLAFVALVLAYGFKAAANPAAVRAEFEHPVAGKLFGTPLISLLLLPMLLADTSLALARLLWVLGALGMLVFAWSSAVRWMAVRHATSQVAPSWIVPVVGLLDLPLALPQLQWSGLHGLMVFSLAVGLFFALPLFTLVFARLALDEPLAPALQPSLLILVAPFAVGFSAYVTTVGAIDLFAEALYMLSLFLLAVLLGRLRHLPHCSPFKVSWWAASFPLAASAVAALRYAEHAASLAADLVAGVVLAIATLTILVFLLQTLAGLARGNLHELA
ncbi:C4-dicarboxylate ABC transporter [Massilia sp. KIM]|uniref:SLAC1 anion channel family protein n=1 Tax=Massilia sp. KIM TaxID=1955422 RepID=UPI00098ED2FB|nr:SLAC1 anion channel family protein [Massilia sp. KIM]OON60083.1 C4-dicarboxylate ABC transporter [Massilia sp. KIM]